MKKFLFLVFAVMMTFFVSAQTIVFQENFELPTIGLTSSADSAGFPISNFQAWAASTHLYRSGVKADSNIAQSGKTIYFTTPSFATTGNSFVVLEFSQICKLFFADGGIVEISVNGGVWSSLTPAQYLGSGVLITSGSAYKFSDNSYSDWASGTNNVPTNTWWKNEKFDISSVAANQTDVKIRFKFTGSGQIPPGGVRYGWLLDDIKVSVSPSELNPPSVTLVASPSDTIYTAGPYNVSVFAKDVSGVETVNLHYKYGNATFNDLPMTRSTTVDSLFTASIPFGGWGKKISYYVTAVDSSSAHNSAIFPATTYKSFFCKYANGGLITIGVGTDVDKYLPIEPNYGYSYSQSLYNSSLIQCGGSISKISYYAVSSLGFGPDNFKLYMGNTTKTIFASNSDWEPISNLTLVYDGVLTVPAGGGWVELTLTTPFNYNGSGSLVVGAYEYTSGYHPSSDDFYCTQYPAAGNVSMYYYNDYTNPSPASPPSANSTSNFIPNTKFLITASSSLTQDAGIAQIVNPAGGVTANAAFNVEAKIKNFGSSVLTKASVKYSIDGNTPIVYPWIGNLNKDSVSTTFIAGILNLPLGGHSLKIWADLPNDSLDLNNFNDTAYISFYACASPLSGNYTLGGATADFATFADAMIGLTQCGINGPVVFNINAGTYSNQLTIPEIFGSSAVNTITFKAASNDSTSVIMNYNATAAADNWIIKLNGADYIKIKNINFAAANTTFSNAIVVTNGATNNEISANLFTGNPGTTADLASVRIENVASINNTIFGNYFNSASMAVLCKGVSNTSLLSNISIKNNTINNFSKYGVFGEYVNKMLIEGNKITSDVSVSDKYGIFMHYAYDTIKVVRNNISLNGANNTYGILFDDCHATDTTRGIIANNMVSITNGTNYAYGIRTLGTDYQKVYFNSVLVNGANLSDTRSINIATSSANIDILNNNLQSNRYPLHVEVNNAGKCDYNNYFATGSVFVLWNSTAYANMQALRTASLKDSNSVAINPYFLSPGNLHTFNGLLTAAAKTIAEVSNDIDGDLRSNPPCIGADEFLPPANDATLISVITNNICGLTNAEDVKVIIKNIGTAAISTTNLTATYGFMDVNNNLVNIVTPENVNRTIAPGDTVHYTFNTKANLSVATTHIDSTFQIKAWVDLMGDYAHANDSNQIATLSSFTPLAPVVSNFNCGYGSTVTLTATSSDTLYWYDAITAGNLLYKGLYYTTVPLFSPCNYYVEAKATSAVNVQIGSGTSTQYYPFDLSYGYGRSASVYKASEIGGYGLISALQYQISSTSSSLAPIKIYLKEISSEVMVSQNWVTLTTGAVLVYDNSVNFDQAGWKNFQLTVPFNFISGNLMILCESNYGGYGTGSASFEYTTTPINGTHLYIHKDASAPTASLSLSDSRPNVKITANLAGCASPRVLTHVNVAAPPPIDLGTIQITSPSQSFPAAVSQAINVKIKNYGLLALTSANVNYQIDNGIVNTFAWTAITPLAFDSTKVVNVANLAFTPGSHKIKAWTSLPNNVLDTFAINDTISSIFLASLHGTYTVGATIGSVQRDFPSFSAANAILDSAGVCDNVVFLVDSGTYNERLFIGPKTGMSANATVSFTSANGDSTDVVLHYATSSTAAWAMKFNGASYFRFNKMTLSVSGGDTYSRIMEFALNANQIEISNCVIEGISTTSSSDNYALIYANGAGLNDNTFKNNLFLNGSYGIYLYGLSSSSTQKGNIISNNKFTNFYEYGIYSYYQDSIQIVKNNLNTTTSNNYAYGIYAAYNNKSLLISKNIISINSTSTSSWGSLYGLYLNSCIGTAIHKGLVANNTISVEGGSSNASIYGIYSDYSNFQNLYYNSVNMISAFTQSRALYISGGSDIKVINNNFVNNGGGFAYYLNSTSAVVASDYNNLFTSGSMLANYNYTDQNTLINLKSATGKDVHSISLNPLFVSNYDLHLLAPVISAAATPIAEVTDDIDGQIRNLVAPTIGAVEFPLYQHDAGVIAILRPVVSDTEAAVVPVRVIVKNFGTDTITTMPVYYRVNNGTPVLYTYNGSLASLKVDTIMLPNLIVPAGNNTICANTSLVGDINPLNEESCNAFFGIPLYDAQVTKITPINGGCALTTAVVKIWIKNKGIFAMNNGFSAHFQRVGESVVTTENISTAIAAGDSLYYTFNTPVNLAVTTQDSNFHINAWVTLLQDHIHSNDTAKTVVNSLHTPLSPLVNNITIPYGTSAHLLATSIDPIYWYDTLVSGNSFHNGGNYVTPYMYTTDTFYVEARTGFSANITLGNGTNTQGYPFYTYYKDSRTEMLYKASELTAQNLIAGTITSLAFDIVSADAAVMNSFTIKMQNYTPNTLSAFHTNGWQTVYTNNYNVPGTGWQAIQLQTPFSWDGVSNVLVSVCFDNTAYTSNSTVNTTNAPDCVFHEHDDLTTLSGCVDLTGGSVNSDRPNIKFIADVAGCGSARIPVIVNVGPQSPIDAGIIAIVSPSTAVNLTNNETVTVKIKNFGSTAISNFVIKYKVDNNTVVSQTITETINPNDTLLKSFTQTSNLSSSTQPQNFVIKAWTALTADATALNDSSAKTLTNLVPVYCPSSATSIYDMNIVNVNLGTINNTSLPVGSMYSDFTNVTPTNIQPGMMYPISVSSNFVPTSTYQYAAWLNVFIDLNRDGIFDTTAASGERVYATASQSFNTVNGFITIPFIANPGLTRMRVVLRESGDINNSGPCGTYTWGETEDYTVNIIPPIPHDGGISMMNGLAKFLPYTASNSQSPQFFVRNYGSAVLTSATMNYVVNNAAPITQAWTGSLLSLAMDSVIQNVTLTPGMNTITAYTNGISGDSNHNNDTLQTKVFKEYITTPPYTDNFEVNKYWFATDTVAGTPTLNLWEQGIPTSAFPSLNAAHSPVNVWATNLSTNYPVNNYSVLYTPVFNINIMMPDTLKFWQWRQFGADASGQIEYKSLNGNWLPLGDTTGTNWFNSMATHSWTGIDTTWKLSKYCIKNLVTSGNLGSTVQFRFIFSSTTTTPVMKGWAIDDFELTLASIPNDGGVISITTPSSTSLVGDIVSVNVTVKNFGTSPLLNLPVKYVVNTVPVQSGTYILAGPLAPGATANVTFTQTFQVGVQSYILHAFTSVVGDLYIQNDTALRNVTVNPAANDVAVTEILQPGTSVSPGPPATVKVSIKNFGTNTQTSIPLAYQRGTQPAVNATWTGSLAAGATVEYTFATMMNVPSGNSFSLCAFTKLANDAYIHNDTICKSVAIFTGINDLDESAFWLGQNMPNPTTGLTNIEYMLPIAGDVKFDIINFIGQKVYAFNKKMDAGKHLIDLNVSDLSAGVYYYAIEFKGKRLVKKMIVNK